MRNKRRVCSNMNCSGETESEKEGGKEGEGKGEDDGGRGLEREHAAE